MRCLSRFFYCFLERNIMAPILTIKVFPKSGKQCIVRDKSGVLKVYLKSPAEGGKANAELIKFFSKSLKLPQHDISIVQGETSRNKQIKIESRLDLTALLNKMGIDTQMSL